MLEEIISLLLCPACEPCQTLVAPTTLRCSHTICSSHLNVSSTSNLCPVASCPSRRPTDATTTPPVSSSSPSSTVTFIPAIPVEDIRPHDTSSTDVIVNKLLTLVEQHRDHSLDSDLEPSPVVPLTSQADFHSLNSSQTSDDGSDDDDLNRLCMSLPPPLVTISSPSPSRAPSPVSPPRTPPPTTSRRRRRDTDVTPSSSPKSPSLRPRKRRKQLDTEPFRKELLRELTCEICFMIFHQPITTPCQHTFCSQCLHRSLDHSNACPLCRYDLPGFSFFQNHPTNHLLFSILLKVFPEEYEARAVALAEEERHARLNTPVFVCQLSFPGVPTLLHFFEPRYRLMLRRLLATPRPAFGMIMRGSADFGTMLEVRSVQMLPDGRSMVETWGTHRFRILERGTLDGYMVARIDRIDDFDEELDNVEEDERPASNSPPNSPGIFTRIVTRLSPPPPPSPISNRTPTTRELAEICTAFLRTLSQGTAPWVVQRLNNTYGPPPSPEDIAAFGFWVALVLPIDEEERAKLLPIRSARLRLRIVVAWINRLQRTWWFENGCSVM